MFRSCMLEREALGACLLGGDVMARALDAGMEEDCFTLPTHRRFIQRMLELHAEGNSLDLGSVYEKLEPSLLEALGGIGGIHDFMKDGCLGILVDRTVGKLLDLRRRRRAAEAMRRVYDGLSAGQDLELAMRPVLEWQEADAEYARGARRGCATLQEILPDVLKGLEEDMVSGRSGGVPTGIPALDALTGGLQPGRYYVLGARCGTGKTAFALNVALAAAKAGGRALFITAETCAAELVKRLVCIAGQVDLSFLAARREGRPTKRELSAVTNAVRLLKQWGNIAFLNAAGYSVEQVASLARAAHRRAPLSLLAVDYIQLLRSELPRAQGSEVDNIGEVSMELCRLAKAINVPMLALSQLNRDCAKNGRLPRMEDLKGCGQMEQDADMVLLLDRPLPEGDAQAAPDRRATLHIAKNRYGTAGGSIPLRFIGEHYTFVGA